MQVFFKFFFILTVSTIIIPITRSQTIYYQDIFKGGVTGDGFIVGANSDTCFFSLYLNNAQNIKKAFLFCENRNNSISKDINFNGTNYEINENYDVNNQIDININGIFNAQIISRIVDVTQAINIGNNTCYLVPPSNQPSSGEDDIITGYYLLVLYENSLLPNVNFTIYQNNQNANSHYYFDLDNLNPININFPVGLALHTTDICNNITDGSIININGNELGIIGGIEPNLPAFCSGVSGSYYYENNTLFGLSGDTPDNSMDGADGLADINSYLTSSTEFDLSVYYQTQNSFLEKTNQVLDLFLTYTSTCEAFPVTVSTDTTICRNETVQLSASGGTQYLWQPATDLSCVYCPNPIFTGDSSRFYTVRIWNNDSCSVVRPVKVNVRQLPAFSSITSTPSDCNGTTGKIISSANLSGETYSLNGGTPQNSGNFFNLAPGDYTLSVHELNSCTNDTVITVGSSISTNAFFTATPTQGAPPLWVNFTNQSTNASNYEWFLNGISQGNNFPAYLFDTTGNYTVTLVAWPENPSCSDSFELQIYVFDSLIVQVPNVFTPNNDQSNDLFGITTNSPVTVEYQLFNRWGNEMIAGKSSIGTVTPSGLTFTPLWDGNNATEGTYFYKLTITAQTPKGEQKRTLDGFFVLVR